MKITNDLTDSMSSQAGRIWDNGDAAQGFVFPRFFQFPGFVVAGL
jgi:hypothetical protein